MNEFVCSTHGTKLDCTDIGDGVLDYSCSDCEEECSMKYVASPAFYWLYGLSWLAWVAGVVLDVAGRSYLDALGVILLVAGFLGVAILPHSPLVSLKRR